MEYNSVKRREKYRFNGDYKMNKKQFYFIILNLIFFYIGIIVHEIGHLITLILLDYKIFFITITLTNMNIITQNISYNDLFLVYISGFLISFIFGFCIFLINYLRKNYLIASSSLIICIYNSFYLLLNSSNKYDGYYILQVLGIFYYLIFITILITIIILEIISIVKFNFKLIENE